MTQQIEKTPVARLAFEPIVRRLRRYNEWRRGADFDQPSSAQVGADIEAAADMLERMGNAIAKTLKENGHLADGENCTLRHLVQVFHFF